MATFSYSEVMPFPATEVFDYMMDFRHAPKWRSLVNRMGVVGGGAPRSGCDIEVTFDVRGTQRRIITHVTEVDRPRLFSFWNENDGIRGDFRYELEPAADGCRVRFTCVARPRSLNAWLSYPWLRRMARMRYSDQLANLRRAMESGAVTRGAV